VVLSADAIGLVALSARLREADLALHEPRLAQALLRVRIRLVHPRQERLVRSSIESSATRARARPARCCDSPGQP
jgi:hypothetical protein